MAYRYRKRHPSNYRRPNTGHYKEPWGQKSLAAKLPPRQSAYVRRKEKRTPEGIQDGGSILLEQNSVLIKHEVRRKKAGKRFYNR